MAGNNATRRACFFCIATAIAASVVGAGPDADRVREQFKSDNYTVKWGTARTFDSNAELEVGDGWGHGFTLGWLRFRPENGRVNVLSLQVHESRQRYSSKWPPDLAPVTVKWAQMKPDAYAALLRDLAVVEAAELHATRPTSWVTLTSNFWVHARLTTNTRTLIDLDWTGYWRNDLEADFAKPRAAVRLARAATAGLKFAEHKLTEEERGWASAKFTRDWKRLTASDDYWWVKQRYIIMIGVVGDKSALSALRAALQGDPKDQCVYYAINAITRLTGQDVRDKPVEEMDLEKTRRRVLDLLSQKKEPVHGPRRK